MTMVIGLLLSYCCKLLRKEETVELDPNLYFPVIANRIRRKQQRILEMSEDQIQKDTATHRKYIFTLNSSKEVENNGKVTTTKL